ncbi:hypothetical protein CVT26_008386 [Gymnopilus dilepis]|uniref:F-box domain-containing protein n=1 Tax=Gymnopilus dilepis TaxID=231916 RepID=A0A409XYC0_9AGAR|nr:hypothetical protein CVT26_008386 [Gymnopilus dilepis]
MEKPPSLATQDTSQEEENRWLVHSELFEQIVSHVTEQQSLLALCLSSRTLHYVAQRKLYSAVTTLRKKDQHALFLATIIQNPRLARQVQDYHCYSVFSLGDFSGPPPLESLVHQGFVAMKNLKALTFRESSGQPCAEILDRDNGATFQLTKLDWGSHSEGEYIRKVLVQQASTLRELSLNCTDTITFPQEACPHLDYLAGNYYTLKALLSGRCVTRLVWDPDLFDPIHRDDFRAMLGNVKMEVNRIHTMTLVGYFGRPRLDDLSGFFTGLEILELVGLHDAEEIYLLELFPSLREVVLSPIPVSSAYLISFEQRQRIVGSLFERCRHLLLLDMIQENLNVPRDQYMYQRWERGKETPSLIPIKDALDARFY